MLAVSTDSATSPARAGFSQPYIVRRPCLVGALPDRGASSLGLVDLAHQALSAGDRGRYLGWSQATVTDEPQQGTHHFSPLPKRQAAS